ncbi:hypothetical protein TraAM80_08006 [Trypanosoma rangeli]|uniref:Uncharacterized protein n=1 Tax=Trypanosoma rangeli TaxID=5698 RepID=A0A3R7KR85_TRYRA|nr:uncharacterized protein TraAM80_08006 [Trypanosoma rangeli]RNE99742.1 hypothetical protein TraAM80_08006 [Trypanosoma rangeli]|eukprot:RNE99742.1 hypothetical protein TraAM80_08006 [Trypanosoma rangeli]
MSTNSRTHETINAVPLHGAAASEVAVPLDGSENFQSITADAHDMLLCAQTERDMNACRGHQASNVDDCVSFGDFFFHGLSPEGGGDAAQPAVFEGFCFDDICGDGAWPASAMAVGTTPGETAEESNHPTTLPLFDFLLSEDATSTAMTEAVNRDTEEERALRVESGVARPNSGVRGDASAPLAVSTEVPRRPAPQETKKVLGEITGHFSSTTTDITEAVSMAPADLGNHSTRRSSGGNNTPVEVTNVTKEVVNNVSSLPFGPLRQSLKLNDTSVSSAVESATTTVGAAPRVPRESVDKLLRRADYILSDGGPADAVQDAADGGSERNGNQSDILFSAQVSHWLRRCVEVQEASLAAVADLQLRTTQTIRLFSAHSGLSSALGPQYSRTPVVLTLPLVLPLMESLLEED